MTPSTPRKTFDPISYEPKPFSHLERQLLPTQTRRRIIGHHVKNTAHNAIRMGARINVPQNTTTATQRLRLAEEDTI